MSRIGRSVVHCIRSDNFAGVERYVATVAPELARRGFDVHVIGGDPDRMREVLAGVPYSPVDSTLDLAKQLLRCDRGALVHAHMTEAEAAATAARAVRRFALVSTRHFAATRGATTAGRAIAPFIRRVVDRQIAISHFVAASIGEPSVVILNGVPINHRQRAPEPMVLVAQRLEREKCTHVAVEAWARAGLHHRGWRLMVAGTGSEQGALTRLAETLDVEDSVDFVGRQSDVTSLLSRAAIFLATAPDEPFGLSVAEAMAAGTAVIAARGGGHVETAGAAGDQWLFPPGDIAALAAMLDALGAGRSDREREGARLRAWQRDHLSIEQHVDQLERVYAELRP